MDPELIIEKNGDIFSELSVPVVFFFMGRKGFFNGDAKNCSPELIKQTDLMMHKFHRDYEFSWFSATS